MVLALTLGRLLELGEGSTAVVLTNLAYPVADLLLLVLPPPPRCSGCAPTGPCSRSLPASC